MRKNCGKTNVFNRNYCTTTTPNNNNNANGMSVTYIQIIGGLLTQ